MPISRKTRDERLNWEPDSTYIAFRSEAFPPRRTTGSSIRAWKEKPKTADSAASNNTGNGQHSAARNLTAGFLADRQFVFLALTNLLGFKIFSSENKTSTNLIILLFIKVSILFTVF